MREGYCCQKVHNPTWLSTPSQLIVISTIMTASAYTTDRSMQDAMQQVFTGSVTGISPPQAESASRQERRQQSELVVGNYT